MCANYSISLKSKPNKAMSDNESESSEVVAVGAVRVSVFGPLVWPRMLLECLEAEDR